MLEVSPFHKPSRRVSSCLNGIGDEVIPNVREGAGSENPRPARQVVPKPLRSSTTKTNEIRIRPVLHERRHVPDRDAVHVEHEDSTRQQLRRFLAEMPQTRKTSRMHLAGQASESE